MTARAWNSTASRYGQGGQDVENEINSSTYFAEFWMYDTRLGRRWNIDPKPNTAISSYACFGNNPIFNIDPFGDSTFASANKNGTFKVTGGTLHDNDNGIYLKENGKVGKMIGYSATPESFYNSDEKKWMGTINPNDKSGSDFLNNDIIAGNPNMANYAVNATGGEKYDFKRTNGTSNVLFTQNEDFYRGMPLALKGKDPSVPVFGSARDVGNMGAGLVAGRAGLSWPAARFGFDALQTKQEFGAAQTILFYPLFGVRAVEGSSTQYGERLGFRVGTQIGQAEKNAQLKRLPSYGDIQPITISNSILIRSSYTPWK